MAFKNIAVYGIYPSRSMVEKAVEKLKDEGFRNTDISVLFPEYKGTKEFSVEKETKAPEGAVTGAGTGAVIGGALGWLMGIGSLAIPGVGPFIAAGPIMAALAGAGAGGLVGGIAGALIGMGIPEYESKRYEDRIKEGGILLSVHVDDTDWKNKGKDILENTGAEDIGVKGDPAKSMKNASDPPLMDPVTRSKGPIHGIKSNQGIGMSLLEESQAHSAHDVTADSLRNGQLFKTGDAEMMNQEEERLIRSGLVQNFVKQKGGQWNHKDWLGFLASVRSAGYHSLSDDQIGKILEQEKVKKVEKQQTAKSDEWQVGIGNRK